MSIIIIKHKGSRGRREGDMCLCMHIRRSRWEPRQIHPQPPLPFSSTGCLLTTAPSMIALSRGRYNVLVCAISFAILFAAYNTLQNYATSLFPGNLGQVSLGVLYGVAGITVFTGPALTHVFGTKYVMFGGALCYVVYLVSLIWLSVPLVLTTSVIIGWGAAVLWIALGVFLTENSTKATYATNTGLFWSIFQFNNIVGNLTTYFVISNVTNSTAVLYLGFAVVAGVGTLGLLLLRPAKEEGEELEEASELLGAANSGGDSESSTLPSMSLLQHLGKAGRDALAALRLLPTPNMLLLLPVFFFSGGELAFWTGEFPLLLSNASMANIGLVLTWAGVGEVLGGFTMGRLSDLVGRSVSLVLSLGLYGGALALTCQLKLGTALATPTLWGSPVIAFIAAFLFGLADAGFNTNA